MYFVSLQKDMAIYRSQLNAIRSIWGCRLPNAESACLRVSIHLNVTSSCTFRDIKRPLDIHHKPLVEDLCG